MENVIEQELSRVDDIAKLPALLTPEEVAQIARLSRNFIYVLVKEGRLPSVKFGRQIRIPRKALSEVMG